MRLIVSTSAGGAFGTTTRILAEALATMLSQSDRRTCKCMCGMHCTAWAEILKDLQLRLESEFF